MNITSIEAFDLLLGNDTKKLDKIIFKHSFLCPISSRAKNIFEVWLKSTQTDIIIVMIDVIKDRELSSYIANRYGVVHQSPQILWLDSDNSLRWSASHHQINQDNLNLQLRKK